MLRRCRSKPARVLFKSIFFIFSTYRMRELHLCLLNRSGCSACVPPVSQYMEPKMPLQKQLELRHRAHSLSHRLQQQHSTEKMVYQCLGSLKCILAQLKPEKREGFPSRQWRGKLFQVGMGLVLFVLLNGSNI